MSSTNSVRLGGEKRAKSQMQEENWLFINK